MSEFQKRLQKFRETAPTDPTKAFVAFVDEFEPYTRRYCRRMLEHYHPQYRILHGDDGATQSIFGSVWRVVRNIDKISPDSLRGLAFRISQNKLWRQNRKYEAESSPVYHEEQMDDAFDKASDGDICGLGVVVKEEWSYVLNTLPASDQQIATLLWQSYTAKEIAEALDITVSAAEKVATKVRQNLARHYPA